MVTTSVSPISLEMSFTKLSSESLLWLRLVKTLIELGEFSIFLA